MHFAAGTSCGSVRGVLRLVPVCVLLIGMCCLAGCLDFDAAARCAREGVCADAGAGGGGAQAGDSGFGGGQVGPSDGGIPLGEYCSRFLEVFCSHATRCGVVSSMPNCVAMSGTRNYGITARCEATADAVDAGRQAYSAQNAAACIATYATVSCGELLANLISTCGAVTAGALARGDNCFSSADCSRDDYCSSDYTLTCGGRCLARAPVGTVFVDGGTVPCAFGSEFVYDRCIAAPKRGDVCRIDAGVISVMASCPLDSYCDGTTSRCAALRQEGEPCTSADQCLPPSYVCAPPADGGSVCQRFAAAGEACAGRQCSLDLQCVSDGGTSYCAPHRALGDACSPATFCTFGSACGDVSDGDGGTIKRCVAAPKIGEPCSFQNPCGEGYCSGNPGTCQALRRDNEPCQTSESCESAVCRPPPDGGVSRCRRGTSCQ